MAQILPFCRAGRAARVCFERALAGSKEVNSHDAGAVILTFARHANPQQTGGWIFGLAYQGIQAP